MGHIAHHRREEPWLNTLLARNAYNGQVLWKHKLPDGYVVHRSAFIATRDIFYMLDGEGCLKLDPRTGETLGRITMPSISGEWKWMVKQGDTLYVMAGKKEPGTQLMKGDRTYGGWSWADLSPGYYGPQVPYGFGDTVAAYDMKEERLLWKHAEEKPIDSRALAMRDGKFFLYCPESHLRCLSAETAK